jgi:hypothetical protein
MKGYDYDQSQETFANQDLDQILRHCRTLHNQAVFDSFRRLIVWGQQFFKRCASIFSQDDRVKKSKPLWDSSK